MDRRLADELRSQKAKKNLQEGLEAIRKGPEELRKQAEAMFPPTTDSLKEK